MRKGVTGAAGIFLCFCILIASYLFAAELAVEPANRVEKESYSIGYEVGLSMKTDGVEVNFDMLSQGLRDAIDGKEPRLTTGEMKKLIVDLKKKAREAEMRRIQEQIVSNARESEQFLEENRTKQGIITTESGLQYRVLREGDGTRPQSEDFVRVNYRGRFIDGREFDSSYVKGEPVRIQADGVIKGWTEALAMMKEGAKWELFVPPHLAYGRGGLGQRIPPNKVLVFDVELVAVEKPDRADGQPTVQAGQARTVRKMNITGEIAKGEHGYIIRGKKPAEVFTILNADPNVLDPLVKSGKTVDIEARIVSGDNVNIVTIDGKAYRGGATPEKGKKKQTPA